MYPQYTLHIKYTLTIMLYFYLQIRGRPMLSYSARAPIRMHQKCIAYVLLCAICANAIGHQTPTSSSIEQINYIRNRENKL